MAFKLIIFSLLLITPIVTSQKTSIPKSRPIKTIRVKNGDIIDCVDIYKQPAFKHPALKNHIIQMKSNHLHPTTDQTRTSPKVPSQIWQQYGSCPNGTIPIRRTSINHPTNHPANIHPSKVIVTPHHSFSVVLTEGFSYSGAKANIRVWKPYVESANDYSSSKVMLRNGPLQTFDTAEAGWVNPKVYNDNNTHLFAYWTVDGMKNTGCFDLTCPGFVQTSREVVLGGDISDLYGSDITIQISKDPYTSNWFLRYNNKEVGYWPGEIFPILRHQANLVQWGGEVSSPNVGTHPHTSTAMGSGKFADFIFGSSGTIKGMLIEENSNPLKPPENLYPSSDEWDCYDAYLLKEYVKEPSFFYGGPGSRNNPRCQ
ncbi:unnamed protein product [Lactuca virosa]|uniref:Neprosin PEP catalytic domain-containing protein n=1 Tax=Lactuca virosa TaxID=75947 RepID=A0AAU9MIM3_9ASTR|nr:unnamed protein product [Lactuca virosa]